MATIIGSGQITIIDMNDVTISSSAPAIPVRNQLWFDTSPLSANPVGPATLKMWDGTSWKAANITAQEYQDLLATVSGTTRYRGVNAPNGVFTCASIGAATPTVNGQVEITLNWTYTQGTEKADGFTVIWESNAASGVATPTAASTSITVDSYTTKQVLVLPRGKWYSFRLYAFRSTQTGIVPGSLALGSNWSNWTPSLTDISMSTPPAGSGLGSSDDRLGFYTNGAWKTYMDKLGNFFLSGQSGTQSLTWNSATGSLDIVGSITLTNTLSADKLTEGSTNKVFNSSLQIGGRNYIKNASQEIFSGGFTGWTIFSNVDAAVITQAVDAPTSIYGTKSAKFSIAAPAASGSVSNLQWGQLVNISSGKEYTISFWAKSSVSMSNKILSAHLNVSPWTGYGLNYSFNLTATWQFFTKTFTANASDTSARLNFQLGGVAGDVYIDNVKFEDGNKNTAFTLANEDIDTYGTTATWSAVSGAGRPADNATVGATWGINLGSQPDSLSDINSTEGTKLTGVETGSTASSANLVADPSFARTTGIADLTYWTGIDNVNVQWGSTLGLGNASPGVKVFFAGAATNRDVRTASVFPISQGQPIKIAARLYISSDCTGTPTIYLRGEDAASGNTEWVASSVSTTAKGSWITHTATLTPILNTTVRAKVVLSLNSATTGYVIWDRAYAGFAEEGSTLGASWGTNLQNIPTTLSTPSGSGLFLSSTNMGYYSSGVWKTYIDNNGNLKLGDDLTSFNTVGLKGLHWDQINGIFKIRGQINASDIVTSSLTANRAITVGGIDIKSGSGSNTGSISLGKASGSDLSSGNKGFWLGSNGASAQFLVGSDTQYFQWDGSKLVVKGDVSGTGNYKWIAKVYPESKLATGDVPSSQLITGKTLYWNKEYNNSNNLIVNITSDPSLDTTVHLSTNIYVNQTTLQSISFSCNRPCSFSQNGVMKYPIWPNGTSGVASIDVVCSPGWHTLDFYYNDNVGDGNDNLTILTDVLSNTNIGNIKAYPVDAAANTSLAQVAGIVKSKGAGGKRQCVLSGTLDNYGTPNIIEYLAGVVGTTIPTISRFYSMNASVENPATITFADGFSDNGPVDHTVSSTVGSSDPLEIKSIETSYIYSELLDIFNKELGLGYTTLKPIYSEKMQDASNVLLTGTDLTPYAWASDGTQINTSYSTNTPDKAFDGNTGTFWQAYRTTDVLGAYAGIGAKLNSKMRIRKLRYTSSGTTGNNPSRIVFKYIDLPEGQTPDGNNNWLDPPDMAVLEMEQTDVNGEYTFDIPDYPGGNWFKIGFLSGSYTATNRWAVPELQVWATKVDQHWFDLKEWRMKVYNPNTTSGWDYKKRVFIGEDEWKINSSGTTTASALQGATTITAAMSSGLSLFLIPPRPISKDHFVVIETGSNRHVTYLDWVSGSTYKLADALPFALPSGSKVTQYENVDTFTYAYGGRWSSGEFRVKGGKTYDFKHNLGTDNIIISKLERQDSSYQWSKDTKLYNAAYFGGSINFNSSYLSLYYKTNVGHADTHGAGSFAASAQTKGEAQIIAERSF